MSSWRRPMDTWLSTHWGVIGIPKLIELGCSERNALRMAASGELLELLPGVFRSAQWPLGREQKMAAACARNPAALVSFTTACQEWMFRGARDPLVHVLLPHGHSPELEGIVVHRCRRIDPVDIVERPDGIRLTSPPRTLFDSADMLGVTTTTSILEQLLDEQRLTFGTIVDTFERLYHPRRPGSSTMLAVIRSRPHWRTALQSDLEVRVLAEISRQKLLPPCPQYQMMLPDKGQIVIDFAWPELRLAVEVDHPTWHAGAAESHRDKGRDRKLATIGWTSARITNVDVGHGLPEAVADIGAILARLQHAA
jgi:hypothetical protein